MFLQFNSTTNPRCTLWFKASALRRVFSPSASVQKNAMPRIVQNYPFFGMNVRKYIGQELDCLLKKGRIKEAFLGFFLR